MKLASFQKFLQAKLVVEMRIINHKYAKLEDLSVANIATLHAWHTAEIDTTVDTKMPSCGNESLHQRQSSAEDATSQELHFGQWISMEILNTVTTQIPAIHHCLSRIITLTIRDILRHISSTVHTAADVLFLTVFIILLRVLEAAAYATLNLTFLTN